MSEKRFKIPGDKIEPVASGRGLCLATDHITVHGKKVGFMYREAARDEHDSGWHFFSGSESQEYCDDPKNLAIYDVNTVANYDPAIVPYLDAPPGSVFGRVSGSDRFEKERS